jgi:hypothetical protein
MEEGKVFVACCSFVTAFSAMTAFAALLKHPPTMRPPSPTLAPPLRRHPLARFSVNHFAIAAETCLSFGQTTTLGKKRAN